MTSRKYASMIAYLVLVVTAVALVWYANRAESAVPERYEMYVVGSCDKSIWDIARDRYKGHTGKMVHRIRELNGKNGKLRSTVIHVGDMLLLPVERAGR